MSWEQMLSIRKEAVDIARAEQAQPPTACPDCGEPLTSSPDGTLFCRFDGQHFNR